MAKRGGVQQLQAEINTDEELEKFLEREGLLVLDVYSEWCGPCTGMIGTLKRIKLEMGGDKLHLAICKSDNIEALKRFRQKSQPTWLFVKNGMAVNLLFGTHVPKLTHMIAYELKMVDDKDNRHHYEISEPQPEEVAKMKIKEAAEMEARRIEEEEKARQRRDYLIQVTDEIMAALPEMGVTVFGPQVNRDMIKKILEPADQLKMQCKDRKFDVITREKIDTVHFMSVNPIEEDVLEQIMEKELLFCFWKIPEDDERPLYEIIGEYGNLLMKEQVALNEEGQPDDKLPLLPPILEPIEIRIELKSEESLMVEEEATIGEEQPEDPYAEVLRELAMFDQAQIAEAQPEEEGGVAITGRASVPLLLQTDEDMLDLKLSISGLDESLGGEEGVIEEVVEIPYRAVRIPPVWIPHDHRTHAALIYVFFRNQTKTFLPPDPVPEPPHIIMAFDAYKRKDLFEIVEKHKDQVLSSGFFTSDDPDNATLIAKTVQQYNQQPSDKSDKLVIKVSKTTSHTMLALGSLGPSYVSPNTVVGKTEAIVFFPEDFNEVEEEESEEDKKDTKKKSKKKDGKEATATEEEGGEAA